MQACSGQPWFEESAIDNQLPAAMEQIEQTCFAVGPSEGISFFHSHPRHAAAFGGQRVAGMGQVLFLHQHLFAGGVPLLG
jgi:hypothetical protein